MNLICAVILCSIAISAIFARGDEDGKYYSIRYGPNSVGAQVQFYRYDSNSGRYIPMNDRAYFHVDDMRELGRYIHIPYPYDGGYGPYSGMNIPYEHIGSGDGYEHVSSSSDYLPFNANEFDIPTPDVLLQYGFPNHKPKASNQIQLPSTPHSQFINTIIPTQSNLIDNPIKANINTISGIKSGTQIGVSGGSRQKRSLFNYSQTPKTIVQPSTVRPTAASRPRTRYDDEGKWRIIRQEEKKLRNKYDYFFETENGIYAQEAGKVTDNESSNEGTSGVGFYQYTGDDGKLYRVEYEAGEQGFVPKVFLPKGDHISKQLQKSLETLKDRNLI